MPDQPDMIAQCGELLRRYKNSEPIAKVDPDFGYDSRQDGDLLLASAVLAVAAELRAIDNHLADLLDITRQDGAA